MEHYATREYSWRKAGKAIKQAIVDSDIHPGYFDFTMENLNSHYFEVQRMHYKDDLYAIVTNSAINYIFRLYEL